MKIQENNHKLISFLIAISATIIFIPLIGICPLFDWDEINFAECAREMIVSNNYSQVQLYYQPFWEKPPLFIWMQALSMNLFGVNEFAARFPNAICSVVTLLSIYRFGLQFYSSRFGLIWCLLYCATLLPHFYFKSGIIDPWFNLFLFLSIVYLYKLLQHINRKQAYFHAFLAGLFLGLAVLTKGPAAIVIIGLTLTAYLIWNKKIKLLFNKKIFLFGITSFIFSGSWFIVEILRGHQHIIIDFIQYQIRLFQTGDAGHDGPFFYHFIVLLIGCFPASIFFIQAITSNTQTDENNKHLRRLFLCLFWVVLLLFSVVKTKILHYSSLCYFPITFFASIALIDLKSNPFNIILKSLYWIICIILSLAFTLVGLIDLIKPIIISKGFIKDELAISSLQADGHWIGFEFLIGFTFFMAGIWIYLGYNSHHPKTLFKGLASLILFNILAIALIVPKIGLYSQDAAIEFYKEKANENCYVETHGFKSYAQLFYGNRLPEHFINEDQKQYVEKQLDLMVSEGKSRSASYSTAYTFWLENGIIDKPAYIVIKSHTDSLFLQKSGFKLLFKKNGFSFFVRMPNSTVN